MKKRNENFTKTNRNLDTYEKNIYRQASDSFQLAALLAIAGGYMDAYTYLCRGKVFANAQTGNIVLLGINLLNGQLSESFKYIIPVMAFIAGIIVAEIIRNQFRTSSSGFVFRFRFVFGHWRQIVLMIEVVALIAAAFMPSASLNIIANTLISFVSALQMESFRKMNGNVFASTMCTGNLRSGTECLYQHLFHHETAMMVRWMQYYGIILFFIVGAAIGAFVSIRLHNRSSFFCCMLLLAGIWMMRNRSNGEAASKLG